MAEIIDLKHKLQRPPDNLISLKPWEFRRADWETSNFVQMLKSQAERLEEHRREQYKSGNRGVINLPSHYLLKGGMSWTIRSIFAHRREESKMRGVYYLAGLTDCLINQVNPVLRTDLLKDVYNRLFEMKNELNVNWYGPLDQVLLPIDSAFHSEEEYRSKLTKARTLKELYSAIREGTDEMFDILSLEYVFYCPGVPGCG